MHSHTCVCVCVCVCVQPGNALLVARKGPNSEKDPIWLQLGSQCWPEHMAQSGTLLWQAMTLMMLLMRQHEWLMRQGGQYPFKPTLDSCGSMSWRKGVWEYEVILKQGKRGWWDDLVLENGLPMEGASLWLQVSFTSNAMGKSGIGSGWRSDLQTLSCTLRITSGTMADGICHGHNWHQGPYYSPFPLRWRPYRKTEKQPLTLAMNAERRPQVWLPPRGQERSHSGGGTELQKTVARATDDDQILCPVQSPASFRRKPPTPPTPPPPLSRTTPGQPPVL